jgi:RNA polymerase sigma-70 factor (ECF subfamily)
LSYDEMADVTGAGVSALKMRVKRACERLRELLEEVQDVRV